MLNSRCLFLHRTVFSCIKHFKKIFAYSRTLRYKRRHVLYPCTLSYGLLLLKMKEVSLLELAPADISEE